MSRIRTIKPEFWTSEQVMECSPLARLLFIGLWNFCDDQGVHPASPKTIKAELFPADDIPSQNVNEMVGELIANGLLAEFESEAKRYLYVTGWHHQLIKNPSAPKYPSPPVTPALPQPYPSPGVGVPPVREGKGIEGINKGRLEVVVTPAGARACEGHPPAAANFEELINALPVPLTDIIAAYHRLSPLTIPCVAPYTPNLLRNIAERCRPDLDQLPALENWEAYFEYVNESPLLTGQAAPRDGYATSFVADLEWLTDSNNYRKIAEERRFHRGLTKNNRHQDRRHGIH